MLPPSGCLDPRLWLQANDLAQQHVSHNGLCITCGTATPCRVLDAAQDAMRRAMEPPPAAAPQPEPVAVTPPRPAAPVGARFRHVRRDDEPEPSAPMAAQPPAAQPPVQPAAEPAAEAEPETPVGARFRRESRVGRRRRSG